MSQEDLARYQATLARLQRFSRWTDSRFRIPMTRIEVGAEALIGLIPGIGDLAGLLLASYVLVEAWRAGAPRRLLGRMASNMLIDGVGGLVPVAGDLFDIWFKANTRNTRLLEDWLRARLEPLPDRKPWWRAALLWLLLLSAAAGLAYWLLSSSDSLAFPV